MNLYILAHTPNVPRYERHILILGLPFHGHAYSWVSLGVAQHDLRMEHSRHTSPTTVTWILFHITDLDQFLSLQILKVLEKKLYPAAQTNQLLCGSSYVIS